MTINLTITQFNLLTKPSPTVAPSYLNFGPQSRSNPCLNPPIKALIQYPTDPYLHNSKIQSWSSSNDNSISHSNSNSKSNLGRLDNSLSHSNSNSKSNLGRLDPGLRFRKKMDFLELIGVEIERALRDNPNIRSTSLEAVQNVVHYLQEMGMLKEDFARLFGLCPQVLSMDVNKDLAPVFKFFTDEVQIPRKDIRKCVNRCPRLLVYSVEDKLRPTLYFLKGLGIPNERFSDCSNTVLLVSSVEKTLIPKLRYLQSLGISYEDAVHMVVRAPGIFTFSIENNLGPKFEYLVKEMKGSLDDLLEFPQYFAFSLEKRIKPRHRLLVELNVSMPLPAMLKKTDLDFMHTLKQMVAK